MVVLYRCCLRNLYGRYEQIKPSTMKIRVCKEFIKFNTVLLFIKTGVFKDVHNTENSNSINENIGERYQKNIFKITLLSLI